MVLDEIDWTMTNFENLSMHVRNYFLSVEKMSICSISPTRDGTGVLPSSCFLKCLSYFALAHVLQLVTTSFANFAIFGKKYSESTCLTFSCADLWALLCSAVRTSRLSATAKISVTRFLQCQILVAEPIHPVSSLACANRNEWRLRP